MSGQFGTGAEVSYGHFGISAEMSWVRSVLGPKCLDTILITRCNIYGLCMYQYQHSVKVAYTHATYATQPKDNCLRKILTQRKQPVILITNKYYLQTT